MKEETQDKLRKASKKLTDVRKCIDEYRNSLTGKTVDGRIVNAIESLADSVSILKELVEPLVTQ